MHGYKCDQCGAFSAYVVYRLSHGPNEQHFCSQECLVVANMQPCYLGPVLALYKTEHIHEMLRQYGNRFGLA
jgi:hypothetical protein